MSSKLTAADLVGMGIDQLSRQIFKRIRRYGPRSTFSFRNVQTEFVQGPIGPDETPRLEDAWFRLVDRNLIRWVEGRDYQDHYRFTERGMTSTYGEGALDDPDPAIAAVKGTLGSVLDSIIEQYLGEAIATFHDRRLLASQFCVGAVAERIVFLLRDWMPGKTPSAGKIARLTKIGEIIKALTTGLEELKKARADLPQIADLLECIEHFAHAYRRSRNDVGHPTEVRDVNEDELAVMLTAMQRRYLPCAYRVLSLTL